MAALLRLVALVFVALACDDGQGDDRSGGATPLPLVSGSDGVYLALGDFIAEAFLEMLGPSAADGGAE